MGPIERIDKISELIDASAADHERLEAENAKLKAEIKIKDATIRVMVRKINELNRSY